MGSYKALNRQIFSRGKHSIVPIRMEDRMVIMKWRNEQIYHLRQTMPLTEKDQNRYFDEVVSDTFIQEQPSNLLFSYLEGEKCIGYGGLVHINWCDRNAEISFIMDTELEKYFFEFHWTTYLSLMEIVAFEDLDFHKIFTFAFDVRPHLYRVLEGIGYRREAVLKEHCLVEGSFRDVIIHSKVSPKHRLRRIVMHDLDLTYQWASNQELRRFSLNQEKIEWESHQQWFYQKVEEGRCEYFLLFSNQDAIGSVRFDIDHKGVATISYLIDPAFQGRGYGQLILILGIERLKQARAEVTMLRALVLNENFPSIKIFSNLRFQIAHKDSKQLEFIKKL